MLQYGVPLHYPVTDVISPATVYRRLNGHSSRSTARLKQQLLSESQENTLLKWIKQLTSSGYPVTYPLLRDIASEIRTRGIESDGPNKFGSKAKPIGRDWVPRFIQRHPQIKSAIGRRIEVSRMNGATKKC